MTLSSFIGLSGISSGDVNCYWNLRVKDLGIIEDIDWKLDGGLNVITGETGAGKSLIIDAVELLLTGTSNEEVIRYGANEARIEGIFALSKDKSTSALKLFLTEKGLSSAEDALILNCEIRKGKPGIVRINGYSVTKTLLRQVGQLLIDIHGQSEHLSLLDKKQHLNFLDAYAHTIELRNDFALKVAQLNSLESEIRSLSQTELDSARQEEFLKYQIEEIKRAGLREVEDEELEKERQIISFSERLKEYSQQVYQSLYDSSSSQYSGSALARLSEAVHALKKLVELDPALGQQLEYLDKTVFGLEEVARDIHAYGEKIQDDPTRLEEIESRLDLIRNLKRKYGKTIPEILGYRIKSELELESIGNSSEKRNQLVQETQFLKKEMGILALNLSQTRSQAALKLITDVKKELNDLEMSGMQFEVSFSRTPSPDGIGGAEGLYAFSSEGLDNIEFMVSTNLGEPLKPLAKIASTGEISRFTLALKGALSEADNIPVLIFDEIDIGIGGRSGDIIGRKLWTLARNHQVICITHLPQIAVYADEHFCVQKTALGTRTTSTLDKLTGNPRLNELAAMLAGHDYSQTALKNAAELIKKAESWKKPAATPQNQKPAQLKF